jgi:DNA-binding LacI/PurR family transcriptional regulator
LTDAGLGVEESLVEAGDLSEAGGQRAMRALLAREPDLDAVFAANDLMAVGAMRALREAGRRVPDDVAVVASTTRRCPGSPIRRCRRCVSRPTRWAGAWPSCWSS